jgi:hypothetical protein
MTTTTTAICRRQQIVTKFTRGIAIAFLATLLIAPVVLRADPPLPGAIFTTDSTCSGVDLNIYGDKHEVYLDGGPAHPGAASLPDGNYYVQVTDPSGACVLGTSVGAPDEKPFKVSNNGATIPCIQLCAVLINGPGACAGNGVDPNCGYNDTTNPGGEYKVWVSSVSTFDNNSTKTDNFKVKNGGGSDTATLCVKKFYDANANGIDDDGQPIDGWKYKVFADDNLIIDAETYHCSVVDPGMYHVIEGTPVELTWLHTTDSEVDVNLAKNDTVTVEFGNLCLGAGGGLTLGFWSNKNGQALEITADFTGLTALWLRNASGGNVDFNGTLAQNKTALNSFLLNATATNMANMLSAQLAAMYLNVAHNKVSGSALVHTGGCGNTGFDGSFITITDLMSAANAELYAHPKTLSGSPYRAYQECLKNALDAANNNVNFVQPTPCSFSFPTD